MNRYNIRIDGQVMPDTYSYEELLVNGILEFDDIEVKEVSKSNWTNISSYLFPEEHEGDSPRKQNFYIDESGQAHFNKKGQTIDHTTTNSSSSSYSTYSSSTKDENTGWKIFFSIVVVILIFVIAGATGWGTIPAAATGAYILKLIWNDN